MWLWMLPGSCWIASCSPLQGISIRCFWFTMQQGFCNCKLLGVFQTRTLAWNVLCKLIPLQRCIWNQSWRAVMQEGWVLCIEFVAEGIRAFGDFGFFRTCRGSCKAFCGQSLIILTDLAVSYRKLFLRRISEDISMIRNNQIWHLGILWLFREQKNIYWYFVFALTYHVSSFEFSEMNGRQHHCGLSLHTGE